jgi:DNA topoisomerase IA
MKISIIAEKPSVAREIAKIVGHLQKKTAFYRVIITWLRGLSGISFS